MKKIAFLHARKRKLFLINIDRNLLFSCDEKWWCDNKKIMSGKATTTGEFGGTSNLKTGVSQESETRLKRSPTRERGAAGISLARFEVAHFQSRSDDML